VGYHDKRILQLGRKRVEAEEVIDYIPGRKNEKERKRKIPKFRILLFLIFRVSVRAVAHKTRNQKLIRAETSDRKKCPKVTITICN
jgi:hypothetical protein